MRFAKVSTKQGGEAGSGKQAITAVTISVVIMMSQSAVRPRPRQDPLQLHWFGSLGLSY